MSKYPRDLLITEDVIRDFEERVGVRFINKTECSKALAEHDAKVRAEAIDECVQILHNVYAYNEYCNRVCDKDGVGCDDCLYSDLKAKLLELKEKKDGC